MTVERIIPDIMKERPKTEQAAAEDIKNKETSRVENVVEGSCPSCNTQMRLSSANGIPVHVCMQHSVVMPLRDPEPIAASVETAGPGPKKPPEGGQYPHSTKKLRTFRCTIKTATGTGSLTVQAYDEAEARTLAKEKGKKKNNGKNVGVTSVKELKV